MRFLVVPARLKGRTLRRRRSMEGVTTEQEATSPRILYSTVFAAVHSAASAAWAGTIADSRVGFSADRTLILDAAPGVGKIWTMPPGKNGTGADDQGFAAGVHPARATARSSDIVLAQLHTTVEFSVSGGIAPSPTSALTRHPIGHEVVNGIPTTEYAVDETTPQGHAEGTL